jgi:hypothetical protein
VTAVCLHPAKLSAHPSAKTVPSDRVETDVRVAKQAYCQKTKEYCDKYCLKNPVRVNSFHKNSFYDCFFINRLRDDLTGVFQLP